MFLRELCFFKNTLSRAVRGLASTKCGVLQSAACDKREFSIAKPEFRNRLDQIRVAHEKAVDLGGAGATLRNGVDHQGLTAVHVACRKNVGDARLKAARPCLYSAFDLHAEGGAHILPAPGKARRCNEQLTGKLCPVLRFNSREIARFIGFKRFKTL